MPFENAPSQRMSVGPTEIGAGWVEHSNGERDDFGLKLDDPSFNALIFANLFDDADDEGYTPIWSRSRKQKGD